MSLRRSSDSSFRFRRPAMLAAVLAALATPLSGLAAGARTGTEMPDLTAQSVYQVLLGEIALRRGQADVAFAAWQSLASRTQDVGAIRRALEIGVATRQYEPSLALARRWVELEPENTDARQSLNTLLNLTGRLDELAPQLNAAIAKESEHRGEVFLQLAHSLNRPGQSIAALSLIQTLAAPYPKLPEAHFATAVVAERAGQLDLALEEASQARALRPKWSKPWMLESQLRLRSEPEKAVDLMQTYLREYSSAANTAEGRETRLHLARLLVNANRYAEARNQFEGLAQAWPDDSEMRYSAAILALQLNDPETARNHLERLLDAAPSYASNAHFFLAQIDELQQKPESALLHFKQVLPGERWLESRVRAARIQAQMGDLSAARLLLRPPAGGRIKPVDQARLALAEAALLKENHVPDQALQVLERALQTQPNNVDLLYEAALLAENLGHLTQMEARLRHLLKQEPANALALNALGYSLADHGRKLAEARVLVLRALELRPQDAYIQDSLGWVLFREGKLEAALQQLTEAYEQKADPEIAAHIGEVLWRLKRRDEAREMWKSALHQHPDNTALRSIIQRLMPDLLSVPRP